MQLSTAAKLEHAARGGLRKRCVMWASGKVQAPTARMEWVGRAGP